MLARFVDLVVKINARRTHQLANDNTFSTIDDKRTMLGHEWKIAHENVGFFDFASFTVFQTNENFERRSIGHVALFAAINAVFRVVEGIVHKFQRQIFGVVNNGRNIIQHLAQICFQKTLVRFLLYLDEIGHVQNLINAREAHALSQFSHLNLMHHKSYHPFSCRTYLGQSHGRHFQHQNISCCFFSTGHVQYHISGGHNRAQ